MLHTKSQGHWHFVQENNIFIGFLPYIGVVALTFETFIAIVSFGLRYQVRIMSLASTIFKQIAQWATVAHLEASIMFGDTIIDDAQRQVTLNLKQ